MYPLAAGKQKVMSITTPAGPKGLFPDQTFVARDVVPDALIYSLATVAGNVEGDEPALRVPYVTEDPDVGFVPEGAEIDVDNPELDEILIQTGKLAVITKMSNEAARYADAANIVADSLSRAVTVKANTALLGNTANPTGLLNVAGIHDGGTLAGGNLDALADALTAVEVAGGTATHITMDPASWGVLRTLKQSDGSAMPLLGAPADQTDRRLFGVNVIVTPAMPAGTVLVSDFREIVAAVGPLRLAQSTDPYFTSDSVARRVTWRMGWGVVHPSRLAKVTVTLPGD